MDILSGEKEEILAKLSQSEKVQSEWRSRVSKLEEENAKLRRALEQSMTRLNRMSVDSDFLVDRLARFSSEYNFENKTLWHYLTHVTDPA